MSEAQASYDDLNNAETAAADAPERPGELAGETAGSAEAAAAEQIASLKDQLLRALAEVENIRRRSQKEKEDTAKYAVGNFAKEMLVVADNFRRALDALPKDVAQDLVLQNLITGIEATERQLLSAFSKFGIKPIEAMGKAFDPNYHQVMMEVEDASQPAGTIVKVLQTGYMISDRLLREALVAVAKGGAIVHKVDTQA